MQERVLAFKCPGRADQAEGGSADQHAPSDNYGGSPFLQQTMRLKGVKRQCKRRTDAPKDGQTGYGQASDIPVRDQNECAGNRQ